MPPAGTDAPPAAFVSLGLRAAPVRSPLPAWHARAEVERLREIALGVAAKGGRLAALWGADQRDRGAGFALELAFVVDDATLWLEVPLAAGRPEYPDLADVFACANRMQRAACDLVGIRATGGDTRQWLRHAAWPADVFPLRRDFGLENWYGNDVERYPFVRVEGDGVHEIPVGPVHAGTIEPGHFRFSVVGEKVLRLEERLGYVHKAVDKLFEGRGLVAGSRLAGRISGDSTVAYAWAYAMAVEGLAGVAPPARALWLRALALERERVANHLGDLGYLGNDGGLAFGLAQFMRLKEEWLRLNARLFGHRYLMDYVIPGGVERNVGRHGGDEIAAQCEAFAREVRVLRDVYDDHAGLQDRFLTCGRLAPELARSLGVVGLAARASGLSLDARVAPGFEPYDRLGPTPVTHAAGDVAARVAVRFDEIFESLRLLQAIVEGVPLGEIATPFDTVGGGGRGRGLGRVEGWRGEVVVALESDGGAIRRCHAHDPSWQNWPALEHAVIGNIVPDFPLINKSFNLSYSGADL
jgi:Ni,Fe-hydrogenase III large subunit/Ni,Fe-hydrogenase III component G